ncbi:tetratricopeptide repeat protein [Pseudomonas fulva]|uniref:tetratricopeptide repeat protein n=1 Tax=Pseudomonas TaxID=286 RepID=UPI0025796C6F|nr:tetratricopeptide repeat protein [Pseudomonas sp. UBA7721]
MRQQITHQDKTGALTHRQWIPTGRLAQIQHHPPGISNGQQVQITYFNKHPKTLQDSSIKLAKIAPFLVVALSALLSSAAWSGEQDTAVIAKAKILYNQRISAIPQLRAAAELGDAESQFYLAEALSQPLFTMSKEAYTWYEKSADQGDLYAMYRLAHQETQVCKIMRNCIYPERAPSDWKKQLISIAKEKAKLGDGEAMSILYFMTDNLTWLEKAADAGDSNAQWLLANRYSEGRGFFIIQKNRKKAEERLLKLAAENGSPQAQIAYAGLLAERGDNETGTRWYMAAVNQS